MTAEERLNVKKGDDPCFSLEALFLEKVRRMLFPVEAIPLAAYIRFKMSPVSSSTREMCQRC